MKVSLTLSILMLLFLSACSEGNSKPSYLFKPASPDGVAAATGEVKISNDELYDGIESELFEAETKVFEIKFNRMRALLLKKLMDKDSRKKEMTDEEFISKFITNKVKISEKEIDAFVESENVPAEDNTPQVREKIKNYLEIERKKEAVESWLAEQTKKTPVEVFIQKPRRPVFPVKVGAAPTFGDKDAKVTIVEFSDFQCPYCAQGAEILKKIKKKYGNKVQIAFKNFPLPFHNHAQGAAVAGLCAHEQGVDKFWKLHDEMFAHQDSLDINGLKNLAKKIGLKVDTFEQCVTSNKYLAAVQADIEEGKAIKVKSTPTFFVNGQLINGAQPLGVFSELIDEGLEAK